MAIILRGKSQCSICKSVLQEDEDIIGFPPFVANEMEQFYFISDSGCHKTCLNEHPLGKDILFWFSEYDSRTGPGKRKCFLCSEEVLDYTDYFGTGFLSSKQNHPLYRFNFIHFHKSCLSNWDELQFFKDIIVEINDSDEWHGHYLEILLKEIQSI